MHITQVREHVDSLYSESESKESYEVIKFFITEKKSRGNHYSSDDSYKDFSQEELQEVKNMIKLINNQIAEKMSESEQKYSAEL